MKAAFLAAPGALELRELDMPEPAPGEVVVKIQLALTDGTDLKAFRRGHPKMPMPTRFGHEFAGVISAVGAGVAAFAVGDRVVSVHTAPCGACYWCYVEQEELCETLLERMMLGGYAEYLCVPAEIVARNMYRLPDELSFEAAAFLEPLSCVVHAWHGIKIRPDTSVVIAGVGGFALLHAMVAKALGVKTPLLLGRSGTAVARARSYDLGEVIDTADENRRDAVRRRTDNRGADIVIECTGALEVWEAAPALVRRGGLLILFGGLPAGTHVNFDAARIHYDEIQLRSPFHLTPDAVKTAFDFLANGTVDPRVLITSEYSLDDIGKAFHALDVGADLKIAIRPQLVAA